MKRLFFMSFLVFAVVSGTSAQHQHGKKQISKEERLEMRVRHLTETLGLSDEQKTSLKTILMVDTVRPASRQDAIDRRLATDAKIKALLTDEQKTKYDDMKNKRCERKNRR